eukprot:jgi/Mesen1/5659/ME000286S04871
MGVCLSRDRVSKSVADCDDKSEDYSSCATTSYTHSGASSQARGYSGKQVQKQKQKFGKKNFGHREALPLPPPPGISSLPSSIGSAVTLSGGSSSGESTRIGSIFPRSASQTSFNGSCSPKHLRVFSNKELQQATKFFRPNLLLGEGGFGKVFLGELDAKTPHKQVVAVKKLNQGGLQGHKEWLAEVNILGLLQHNNLVSLIGYCVDNAHGERSLVYEFMSMGSLERHLFCQDDSLPTLPWNVRVKIALEAAMGLAYLHDEQEHQQFIYRDFKASNVLLDHDFTVKLSDFGLAREGPEAGDTHMTTAVMGTYGYTAPEYLMKGHLSAKSDVYSYGVVLLEIMTGLPSMDRSRPPGKHNLVEWAKPFLTDRRRLYKLIDPRLEGEYSIKAAQVTADIVQHCLSFEPRARPSMESVVGQLSPLVSLTELAVDAASSLSIECSASSNALERSASAST